MHFPRESIKSENVEKSGKYLTTITIGEQRNLSPQREKRKRRRTKKSIAKGLIA
jgi:hypothetical protein